MKIVKLLVWIVMIVLFGLLVYQNWDFFSIKQSLNLNLYFAGYRIPPLPLALQMAFMFLAGWLIAYLSGLADRFGLGTQNKRLKQTIDAQQSAIDAMKKDVEALKPKAGSDSISATSAVEGQTPPDGGEIPAGPIPAAPSENP